MNGKFIKEKVFNRIVILLFSIILSQVTNAKIIQCKNSAGTIVYTDNPSRCADGVTAKQLTTIANIDAGKFYNEIPDLLQTLDSANFYDNGNQFCAPVTVSNSLVWLENNRDQAYQINLVKKLASDEYMKTVVRNGTTVVDLLQGVDKYAIERWGGYKLLEYRGWSRIPKKYRLTDELISIDWITKPIHRKGAVWLNLGWYVTEGINYKRVGGHWVTLAGYEKGKLIVHDPASRSGYLFSNQFLSIETIQGGDLLLKKRNVTAKGRFLVNGLSIPDKANFAIIDGAVVLELN